MWYLITLTELCEGIPERPCCQQFSSPEPDNKNQQKSLLSLCDCYYLNISVMKVNNCKKWGGKVWSNIENDIAVLTLNAVRLC